MNPIWRVTMEMSKSRSENQKLSKKRREMLKDKNRKEKEKRRMEALERDRQRFIVGQEQNADHELERDEDMEEVQETAAEKFKKELCWCIQQTQVGLANLKPSSKEAKSQAEEAQRLLRILTSPKAPMAKKRQVMRATFGDYRSKMQHEERKHKADMSKRMCLEPVSPGKQASGTFYRVANSTAALPDSNDLSEKAGSSGSDPKPVDDGRLQSQEPDASMRELERSTEGMHIRNQNERGNKTVSSSNASQRDQAGENAKITENQDERHSRCDGEPGSAQVATGKRSGLSLNLNKSFSFNFDIKERDLDRSDTRWRGSNKNINASLSENSTPEKGPGSLKKKPGSRKRNRGKKKQQSLILEREASITANQAAVSDNQAVVEVDSQATDADHQSTVRDNQKLLLEADREFKFNFPEPTEQSVTP